MRLISIGLLVTGLAVGTSSAIAGDLREISHDCETALALSAAPKHLWDRAGVFVLGSTGYERVKDSENGYECVVERNHADSVIPLCFDVQSSDANLAATLEKGKLLRQGRSFEQISSQIEKMLADGSFPTAGPGVVYMISDFNYIFNGQRDVMLKVGPHVMFHAPHLTSADIGADPQVAFANRGLPIINAEGPHGYMVSFVEHPSDSSRVLAACAGQLPPRSEMAVFPPAQQ